MIETTSEEVLADKVTENPSIVNLNTFSSDQSNLKMKSDVTEALFLLIFGSVLILSLIIGVLVLHFYGTPNECDPEAKKCQNEMKILTE